ncbi:hypothetical protein DAEQUDRAFT_814669 [Daedalea quercina L-15889]|uniref:CFEM domain-containing protein n=1 Tax=Daedalea quercina L-15889 TaxID=1314783 RepID=A0A165LUK9_9APHY|nr:hypothetical protein DAEQUDRAFT_814669 [Daedalea quercina L-15889]
MHGLIAALLVVASAAYGVVAQTTSAPLPSITVDTCVVTCLSQAASSASCSSYSDLACICSSSTYQSSLNSCLQSKCSKGYDNWAQTYQKDVCAYESIALTIASEASEFAASIATARPTDSAQEASLSSAASSFAAHLSSELSVASISLSTADRALVSSASALTATSTSNASPRLFGVRTPETAVWTFDGPISDDERKRFVLYAKFIRTIRLQSSLHVDPSVFLHLSRGNLGTPLLPRLDAIYCDHNWPYMDIAMSLLIGPSLRKLTLSFEELDFMAQLWTKPLDRHGYILKSLLVDICASAPQLETLGVRRCSYPSQLYVIGMMKHLRALDLSFTVIDIKLVQAIAQLEQLEELSLSDVFDGPYSRYSLPIPACPGFRNLKRLTIHGEGWSSLSPLLAAMSDLRISELRLITAAIDILPLETLVSDLPGSHASLERVRMEHLQVTTLWFDVPTTPVATFMAPLFALPNISEFELCIEKPLCIADDDLRKIGNAWAGSLTRLRLRLCDGASNEATSVAPTIQGIIDLANLCPKLSHLSLSSVRPVDGAAVYHIKYDLLVTDFQVQDDRIRDVHQVARVLWCVFRRFSVPGLDRTVFKQWAAVVDEIARLQSEWEREE